MLDPAHAARYFYSIRIRTGAALLAGVTTPVAAVIFWLRRTFFQFYHILSEACRIITLSYLEAVFGLKMQRQICNQRQLHYDLGAGEFFLSLSNINVI